MPAAQDPGRLDADLDISSFRKMPDDRAQALTDVEYWDQVWSQRGVPDPLNPRAEGLNACVPKAFNAFFHRTLHRINCGPSQRLLEAGCGGSVMLPYFAREFGMHADGIDSSPEGCALSEAISRKAGTSSSIFLADLFDPPAETVRQYDVVYSLGLVEHFTPTERIIEALKAFLVPGGTLISVVPNMRGLTALLQKLADPAVYSVHVPLSPTQLRRAYEACGFEVVDASHLMTINLSVVNFSGPTSRIHPGVGLRAASWISKSVWMLQRLGMPDLPNAVTSPYVAVVGRAPK